MRLNAPITALLALAVSLLGPASLVAATRSAHRSTAHKSKTRVAPSKKRARKKPADDAPVARTPRNNQRKHGHRRPTNDAPAPITVERVRTPQRATEPNPAALHTSIPLQETAPDAGLMTAEHRNATSQDFLEAAAASDRDTAHTNSAATQSAEDSAAPGPAAADADTRRLAPVIRVTRARPPITQLDDVSEEATAPVILPTLYNKHGHLIVPKPLKGSHEILVRQNRVADRDGLDRIEDDDDLVHMRAQHLLVALPASKALDIDDRLPSDRRYCRPWTAQFLTTLARAHYARFHTSLQVNSAVRTVEFQQRLQRTNGNAAPAEGETASPHLTGQAIDIAKHGLSLTEIAWLRGYLLPLIQQGRIDVEEEFQQACFHISVYKKYTPSTPAPRRDLATSHHSTAAALATAIR